MRWGSLGIVLVCSAAFGTAGFSTTRLPQPVSHLENGARIFLHGVTAQGRIVQNSHGMEGVGCAMCHGEDGRGGTMHGILAPNITFPALSDPKGFQDPNGRKRPAYNEESVKAAIAAGIDAGGNTLDEEMPRWTGLTRQDFDDLIGYLKTLGAPAGRPGGTGATEGI